MQFPSLHHFELAEDQVSALCAEQAAASAARLDASITAMPAHANFVGRKAVAEPRLSPAQIGELSSLLLSKAPWRDAEGSERVWTEQSIAELIGESFGAGLVDVAEAELSALGRRLTGVEPWPELATEAPRL